MVQVQTIMPDVELVIIGDGPLRLQLEKLAAKSLNRYRFLGLQPPELVKSWMNRSLLLAAPSVTSATGDSEGLPTVIVEAQAMGVPVVGSIHAGIPQAVVHGDTGFLAAERDWNTLATHILRILQDPILWQRFSLNGQQRVRSLFDLHKQTRVLESIYEAALQEQF
jgi:glycosyltransferase involved in cell wall biosynthesis